MVEEELKVPQPPHFGQCPDEGYRDRIFRFVELNVGFQPVQRIVNKVRILHGAASGTASAAQAILYICGPSCALIDEPT